MSSRARTQPDRVFRPSQGVSAALASRLGARGLGLALIVLLARQESVTTFAAYNFLLVLAAAVSVITDSGTALVAGREVARAELDPAQAYRAALPVQIATSLLAGVGVAVAGRLSGGPGTAGAALVWTAAFIFLNGVFNLQAELLRGSNRPWLEAQLQVGAAVLQLGLGALVLLNGWGLAALMAVLAAKQALAVIVAGLWLPAPWGGARMAGLGRTLLRRGLWLGGAATFAALVWRFGQIALGIAAPTREVARYAAASRFFDLAEMACATIGFGLLPAMSDRARRSALRPLLGRLAALAAVGCLVVLPPLVLAAPWITKTVFGDRYAPAGATAQLFVAAAAPLLAMYLAWYALVALRRERAVTGGALAGALAAALGCVWIAQRQTSEAAAQATVVAVFAMAACMVAAALLAVRSASDGSEDGNLGPQPLPPEGLELAQEGHAAGDELLPTTARTDASTR